MAVGDRFFKKPVLRQRKLPCGREHPSCSGRNRAAGDAGGVDNRVDVDGCRVCVCAVAAVEYIPIPRNGRAPTICGTI